VKKTMNEEKECAIVYKTENVKTVSPVAPVIDADRETYQSLKAEQTRLWKEFKAEDDRISAILQKNRHNWKIENDEIEARLKQFARPECYGNLDNHLKRVSGPAQCEACGHILRCYQAQCERGRC